MSFIEDFFDTSRVDYWALTRDLTGLAIATSSLAKHFYGRNNQPYLDRSYRNGLPPINTLAWQDVSDKIAIYTFQGLGDWLQAHDVQTISATPYAGGRSASLFLLKLKSGEIKALRFACDEEEKFAPEIHTRIPSPLVLAPQARVEDLKETSGYKHYGTVPIRYKSVFEILPLVPVLPNDIAALQPIPGHSTYDPDPLLPEILSPEAWSKLEGQKLTFCAFLASNGFAISRVADIGVLPDGTPIFVDPDTLQMGSRQVDMASARVQNLLAQVMPEFDQFKWVDGPYADYRTIMTNTKQARFFQTPICHRPAPRPMVV